jgi:hypothetical protein
VLKQGIATSGDNPEVHLILHLALLTGCLLDIFLVLLGFPFAGVRVQMLLSNLHLAQM